MTKTMTKTTRKRVFKSVSLQDIQINSDDSAREETVFGCILVIRLDEIL